MKDRLRSELHQALKNKDSLRAGTIRMMIAALTNKEKERGKPVNEQEAYQVFYSMLRKREDAINQFQKAKREDLAEKESAEMEIIKEFLPQQLSEEEIRREAQIVISEVGAEDMKSMGKVMGILTKKLAGRAQGGVISKIVKEELSK
ncbi:MAG: GatB/YqeY domain-containing protein [Deltaproteobacteria bacterium]|nr:MAG: GatB/YqeY domain-containing protein [Deltaproteobacteria bacterium]